MNKGFTIPELLVAVFVFSLVMGAAANLFFSGIAGQRNSLAQQELLDQSSQVAEYITRVVRQATKDVSGTCIGAGENYEVTPGGGLKFLNAQGQCHEFSLESERIKEQLPAVEFLTSDNLRVTSLQFAVKGEGQDDDAQPRATIAFEIEGQGQKAELRPKLQFQTTVSQRKADVPQ